MGFNLRGIIAKSEIAAEICEENPKTFSVMLQDDIYFIPITDDIYNLINQSSLNEDGPCSLGDVFAQYFESKSNKGKVGYIEARYWGGIGGQASCLWYDGELVYEIVLEDNMEAINNLLSLIGITPEPGKDEFDTVGLGRYRHIDDWFKARIT